MKKRLLCLFMGLILILSVLLTACSSDDEESDDENNISAQTITMCVITERKVCNTEAELAKYLEVKEARILLSESGIRPHNARHSIEKRRVLLRLARSVTHIEQGEKLALLLREANVRHTARLVRRKLAGRDLALNIPDA